jgi:AcrR family transcriptional regulator
MTKERASRPGGRSQRVQDAVFAAMEALLAENPGDLPSLTVVAARAGVNPTSLYRRWTDARALAGAVAVARLMRSYPVPDTGTLRGDMVGWAASAARSLSTRENVALLRILTAPPRVDGAVTDTNQLAIGPRVVELQAMLARAAARGEPVPSVIDVLEIVLAPIYLRAFFLGPIESEAGVERLVDRVLAMTG